MARNINPLVEDNLQEDCDDLLTNFDERLSVQNGWRGMSEKDVLEELKELDNE